MLLIPSHSPGLSTRRVLAPRLSFHADSARYFVSTILRKTAAKDVDPWGLVRLDSQILRRVMGKHSSEIVKALEPGAIDCVLLPKREMQGLPPCERYLGDRCVTRPAVDPFLIDRLNRERQHQDAERPTSNMGADSLPS